MGEIVPYLVGQIDGYDVAYWRGAALFAMLAAVTAGALYRQGGSWGGEGIWWLTLPTLLGAGLGYASAFIAGCVAFSSSRRISIGRFVGAPRLPSSKRRSSTRRTAPEF